MVVAVLVALVPALVPPAAAQATTGTIAGVIQDGSGGRAARRRAHTDQPSTGRTRTAVSGRDGRFVLAVLPAGAYELRAELAGFRPTCAGA